MKKNKFIAAIVALAFTAIIGLCVNSLVNSAFAQDNNGYTYPVHQQSATQNPAHVWQTNGNPNSVTLTGTWFSGGTSGTYAYQSAGVTGNTGDIAVDQSGGDTWQKTGGQGNTGWLLMKLASSGTVPQVRAAGLWVYTGTSATLYLSSTNGIRISSGTTVAVSGTGFNF